MKTILKRTIGFFLSLAMIISVACSTAVAAETPEDQFSNALNRPWGDSNPRKNPP